MKIYFIILLAVIRLIGAQNNYKNLVLNAIDVEIKYRVNTRKMDLFILDLIIHRKMDMEFDDEFLNIITSIRHFRINLQKISELMLKANAELTEAIDENLSKFPAEFKSPIAEEEPKESRKSRRNKKRKMRRMKNKQKKREEEEMATGEAGPSLNFLGRSNEESDDQGSEEEDGDSEESEQNLGAEDPEQSQNAAADPAEDLPEPPDEDMAELVPSVKKYDFVDERLVRRAAELGDAKVLSAGPAAIDHASELDFEVLHTYRSALAAQRRHLEAGLATKFVLVILYYCNTGQLPAEELGLANLRRMTLNAELHARIFELYANASAFSGRLALAEKVRLRDAAAAALAHYRGLLSSYEEAIESFGR